MSEAETRRQLIDKALLNAGWGPIVDYEPDKKYQEGAVREFPTETGPCDYILFSNGRAIAAIEAKKMTIVKLI